MRDIKSLFVSHAREIERFLRRQGHNADAASDLTQDVFLRILASSSAERSVNPRAYLFQVARNLSVDLYRRDRCIGKPEPINDEELNAVEGAPGPHRIVNGQQRLQIVNQALAQLPLQTRQAFELHRMGNMTLNAVAEEMDISVSRCWTLIRQAYTHLRESLGDD